MPSTDGTWRISSDRDVARRWAGPQLLVASAALLLSVGLLLSARRAIGALAAPLPPLQLVTTAVVVAAFAWSVRVLWRRLTPAGAAPTSADHLVRWLTSVGVLLLAIACCWPGSRWIDWLVWLPIVAADWFGPKVFRTPARRGSPAVEDISEPAKCSLPAAEGQIVQQLTRVRRADGSEMIHGTLAAQFAPGVRTVTLHAAFCPPFARLPQVDAEAIDGPDASVKIVQVLTSGVRIDVQLARAADRAQCARVEMAAVAGDISQ